MQGRESATDVGAPTEHSAQQPRTVCAGADEPICTTLLPALRFPALPCRPSLSPSPVLSRHRWWIITQAKACSSPSPASAVLCCALCDLESCIGPSCSDLPTHPPPLLLLLLSPTRPLAVTPSSLHRHYLSRHQLSPPLLFVATHWGT